MFKLVNAQDASHKRIQEISCNSRCYLHFARLNPRNSPRRASFSQLQSFIEPACQLCARPFVPRNNNSTSPDAHLRANKKRNSRRPSRLQRTESSAIGENFGLAVNQHRPDVQPRHFIPPRMKNPPGRRRS